MEPLINGQNDAIARPINLHKLFKLISAIDRFAIDGFAIDLLMIIVFLLVYSNGAHKIPWKWHKKTAINIKEEKQMAKKFKQSLDKSRLSQKNSK